MLSSESVKEIMLDKNICMLDAIKIARKEYMTDGILKCKDIEDLKSILLLFLDYSK